MNAKISDLRSKELPEEVSIDNKAITIVLSTRDSTLCVTDKRTGKTRRQKPASQKTALLHVEAVGDTLDMVLYHPPADMKVTARIDLIESLPEFTLNLSAEGVLHTPLGFPHPFVSDAGTYLVVPMNEGISYPVEDETIEPMRLIAYGGHGICMGFFGATDGTRGYMAIIETADDASIRIRRIDNRLCIAPEWAPQKGCFGYDRRLRYRFLRDGGHVAMCKRYRAHAQKAGLLKTLKQKAAENPDVDLLVGAVNVWCWERDAIAFVKAMKSIGIERILWSHRNPPEVIRAMNEAGGILTSRYDIYQDLMDPEVVEEKLYSLHPDWTQDGWPQDLMLDEQGRWRKGWYVRGRDGGMYPCGVLCDSRALDHARQRLSQEIKTHPYRCRFIDTTTASPWRECYHPNHPMTRSESRAWKMALLEFMSHELNLVTGSETGHDAAVPYVHYFEGMLSLGPYRVPDAGRRMMEIEEEVPDRVARFQVGHRYRLPLWELVFHDCVVAHWYWGDYNNKLPTIWDKRDLFNILYGTPPMFMFDRKIWEENKHRFAGSYAKITPVARAVGYYEMTDHRFLTADRDVQRTVFANGIQVTVNFGDKPFRLEGGKVVAPMGYDVAGGDK